MRPRTVAWRVLGRVIRASILGLTVLVAMAGAPAIVHTVTAQEINDDSIVDITAKQESPLRTGQRSTLQTLVEKVDHEVVNVSNEVDVGQAYTRLLQTGPRFTTLPANDDPDELAIGRVIRRWNFDRSEDADYDGWPDGWQRQRDRLHPAYLRMTLQPHDYQMLTYAQSIDSVILKSWPQARKQFPSLPLLPPAFADLAIDRYMRIEMNGGWAMIQSQAVPVNQLYRYQLELKGTCEKLVHDRAYAELAFFDAAGMMIAQHPTPALIGSSPWTPLRSELVSVPKKAVTAAVRLVVRPGKAGGDFDIDGTAGFDEISIRRMPQMRVTTDHPLALYDLGRRPIITVRVLGLERTNTRMHFLVRDISGEIVAKQSVPFREPGQNGGLPDLPEVIPGEMLLDNQDDGGLMIPSENSNPFVPNPRMPGSSKGRRIDPRKEPPTDFSAEQMSRLPFRLASVPVPAKSNGPAIPTSDSSDPNPSPGGASLDMTNAALEELSSTIAGVDESNPNGEETVGEMVGEAAGTLTAQTLAGKTETGSDSAVPRSDDASIEGVATWQLPSLRPGFYVIESLMGEQENPTLSIRTTIGILGTLPAKTANSPFGWTLPADLMTQVDVRRLPDSLQRLGVGAAKVPCWLQPADRKSLDSTAWLVGRLQELEIRPIGLLDQPPADVLAKIDEQEKRPPTAANFFRDPNVWGPLLEPIMTRLTLKVRTWQLGSDSDYSFLGRPQLKQTIRDIGRNLQGFGQPIGVAFSWPWLEPAPPVSEESWAALNLDTSMPLAADELDAYLTTVARNDAADKSGAETWLTLDPLDASSYDLQSRIADLVMRMTTTRGHRVACSFISTPLDPNQGLLRPDWRPGELLLPFRTTSLLLGDLTRVGNLPMRKGTTAIVLANASRMVIVMWNPEPATETLYLGDQVKQVDVWGNSISPERVNAGGRQVMQVKVGPMPTFIVDVDPVLVSLRMSAKLQEQRLDSLLGRRQSVTLQFTNPTQETLSGEVRMKQLPDWIVDNRPQAFDVAPGRVSSHTFEVSLRNSAKIGDSQLEFDFFLRTQPQRRFSVVRPIHVGPDGLELEISTRQVAGELAVIVVMTNRTEKAQQYDCMLFPPGGRQYQRRQITIPPDSSTRRVFTWADGKSLVGEKMLLRAMEQGGDRVLNQVVEVAP